METIVTKCCLRVISLTSLLFLLTFSVKAQIIVPDSSHVIGGQSYCNILVTDSANKLINQDLLMHVQTLDFGDSTNGALFTYTLYTLTGDRVNGGSIAVCCREYNAWDANKSEWAYSYVAAAMATRKIYVVFEAAD